MALLYRCSNDHIHIPGIYVNGGWTIAEVTHRVQSGRSGRTIKGKVYRIVVRPALVYRAETWALEKAPENKLEVAEIRMLRWMCGVTKLDKIRNEIIRGTNKVGEITKI